jgi:hypothetical protein
MNCLEGVVQRAACAILAGILEQAVGAVLRVLDVDVDFLVVDFVERLVIAIAQTDVQVSLGVTFHSSSPKNAIRYWR